MIKKTLIAIIIFNFGILNLFAQEIVGNKSVDSLIYKPLGIHAGLGVVNGLRAGINYRINDHFSTDADCGLNFLLPAFTFNAGVNYHFKKYNGWLVNTSLTYFYWYAPDFALIFTPNIGYVHFEEKGIFDLSVNAGLGFGLLISDNGIKPGYFPNLDFKIGINFYK